MGHKESGQATEMTLNFRFGHGLNCSCGMEGSDDGEADDLG